MSREAEKEKPAAKPEGAAVCAACGVVLKDPDRAAGGRGICLCCACYEALLNPYPRCCASGAI